MESGETQGALKWLTAELSAQFANVDVSAFPCVALPRSVRLSHSKAHRAFTPACSTAAFSQGLRSFHLLPPLPHPFHPSCPSAFCSLARTVIKPSACGQGLPPPHPEKATNRLNYERNEGQRQKEASGVWEIVIKTVPRVLTEHKHNVFNYRDCCSLSGKTSLLKSLAPLKMAGRTHECALIKNMCTWNSTHSVVWLMPTSGRLLVADWWELSTYSRHLLEELGFLPPGDTF